VPAIDGVLELLGDERALAGGSRATAPTPRRSRRFAADVPSRAGGCCATR
jgi:hypothetical protein